MSVYIIRPKATSVVQPSFLITGKSTAEIREKQVRIVVNFWRQNPVYQQIQKWLENASSEVFRFPHDLGITGTTIVKMPDDETERMRRELPDVFILRDETIKLIEPVKRDSGNEVPKTNLWHFKAINLINEKGQRISQFTGKNITVAVLDTGIDSEHQELRGKVIGSYIMSPEGSVDEIPLPSIDTQGHGTHVAGSICGTNVGVAPDTKLINCLLIPNGIGNLRDLFLWLDWLASEKPEVDIVNISGGISGYFNNILCELINPLSTPYPFPILPVCAIGNDGIDQHIAPGNCKNLLSVGAINRNHQVASFSGNFSMTNPPYNVPSLVAPGEQIYSSVPGGGYEALSGTSMATAIVSGVAALFIQKHIETHNSPINVGNLINKILSNCIDLGEPPKRQGAGLIQVPQPYET